ncbi:MMPL family transporter [Nitratireductor sp. ZSWI3]|uniref:MMPL family transporter n=1 Tax=Nitratireductor sp. ZSWI3 TaxID=2966359 RepID=UPI00215065DC|nr:MMPL family transporter [Nitratireductor sp. ZSWI3]MCR4265029.1 MMPL family transporter [Nitratireductor sp. ZSWI3]
MFSSLGLFAYRYRWLVLLASGLFVALAITWGSGVFGFLTTGGLAPETAEVTRANDLLEGHFGHRPGDPDVVAVFDDESGRRTVDDPAFATPVQDVLDALPAARVMSVVSYWTPGLTADQRAELVSPDRHATYAVITLHGEDQEARMEAYGEIQDLIKAGDGIATYLGGGLTSVFELQREASANLATAQVISLPILLVLLILFYRGFVAATIPVALGMFAILGSLVMLRLLTTVTDVSIFALEIVMLIGLGLAVDYGLFVVSRFREELERGGGVEAAVIATTATAGRTVAISGLTVITGLSGLLLFPQPISHSFAWGGISAVMFNIVAGVVVLPAVLAILGHRVNAGRVPLPRFGRAGRGPDEGGWALLARVVSRRPAVSLLLGLLALLVAAAPLLELRPGLTNHRYLPADNQGQTVAHYTGVEFPQHGPAGMSLDLALQGPVGESDLQAYLAALAELPVAAAARVHLADTELTWIKVDYRGEADDPGPLQLVRDIRATPPPSGTTVLVGGHGGPAISLDNNAATLAALPGALGFIAAMTLILIALAFRSVLVPIKAVLCAFLSLAASLGIVVWGFQLGGLAGLLDFQVVGTTDLWTPGLIVTIAFGLVTDYEMFLVSRIREAYLATGDNRRAVATGLQQTGSIITRAAILMIVVLATMGLTAGSLFLITFGIGMTLSVVIDATIVRSVVVPAAMQLLGSTNWWAPRWLARLSDWLGLSEGADPEPADGSIAPATNGVSSPVTGE